MKNYRDSLFKYGDEIFRCGHFQDACKNELRPTQSKFKHGPEMCFVGSEYGNFPVRILFTRMNPHGRKTWVILVQKNL